MSSESPGMDAIDAALQGVNGRQTAKHWLLDPSMGLLEDLLESVSAYQAADHWHVVTLGLSNIWQKVADDDPTISGLGFEYTMRVRRPTRRRWTLNRGGDEEVPNWAIYFLKRLGDVTLEGARFLPGETLDPGGPITGDDDGALVAVGFVDDPTLPPLDTPNGVVRFIQVVGMTAAQLDGVRSGHATLDELAGADGLFVTDPSGRARE